MRRFPFRYNIKGYSSEEIYKIFKKKIYDIKWKFDKNINENRVKKIFIKNKNNFKNYGGDIENMITFCKFAHSKRILLKHPKYRRKLNYQDIIEGYDNYMSFKENNEEHFINYIKNNMYV